MLNLDRRLYSRAVPVLALFVLSSCGGGGGGGAGAGPESPSGAAATPLLAGVDPKVAGLFGLPDSMAIHGQSNSGVFVDLVSDKDKLQSIKQPSHYTIVVPAGKTKLSVWVFDGNCEGLWDQNKAAYGAGDTVVPDGSVVEYRLTTDGTGAPELVALAESGDEFKLDDDWEPLFNKDLSDPLSRATAALRPDGSHRYALDVRYVVDAVDALNGFKLAVDGRIQITPAAGAATVIGGFIGGVVDSREMNFSPAPDPAFPNLPYAVSRDWYPNLLTPTKAFSDTCINGAVFRPAVLHPKPDPVTPTTFTNTYDGTFEVPIDLIPDVAAGQTWADFVSKLVLEEGDADDAEDPNPTIPGQPRRGIPADDGQPYGIPGGIGAPPANFSHNSAGYRLPIAAQPPFNGSPWLEVVDPNNVVRATVVRLSGNVTNATGTSANDGWKKIPIPSDHTFDATKFTWKLRMHNLDARNTWFVRSNVRATDLILGEIGDRVWVDKLNDCNGVQDTAGAGPDDERGVNGVSVTLKRSVDGVLSIVAPPAGATWTNPQLTRNLPAGEVFGSPAGAFGLPGYYLFNSLPILPTGSTYVVEIDQTNFEGAGPLVGYARTFPAANSGTTTLTLNPIKNSDRSLDFGYCKREERGRIGDRVWVDQRNVCDGIQDTAGPGVDGEHGVNGVAVSLFLDTGGVLSLVAPPAGATWVNPQLTRDLAGAEAFQSPAGTFGAAGYYLFDELPAPAAGAKYVVQVNASNFAAGGPLFGYARTFPATDSGTTTLSQTNLADRALDFGYCKKDEGRIGDRVWVDQRNVCNGVQDPASAGLDGERGVNGVAVSLFLDTGGVLSLVAPPAGATWVNPQLTRDLSGAEAFQSPAGAFGSAGYYLFDKLPIVNAGSKYVVQVNASNFAAGGPLFGYERTSPATDAGTTTLSPNNLSDRSLDFGYCTKDEGRIGDRVWVDQRNVCNGVQDPAGAGLDGERGVNGVAVSLFLDTGGVLSRVAPPAGATWANPQLTRDLSGAEAFQSPAGAFGSAGYYLFDKLPIAVAGATYVVQVDAGNFAVGGPLFGYGRTFPATNSGTTTLSPNNLSDRSLDFGYCKMDEGRIGDRVWVDQRNVCNGVQDAAGVGLDGERGVNGVAVSLFLDTGGVLSLVPPPAGATWVNPQLTRDLSGAEAFQSPAGAFGSAGYYLFDKLPIMNAGSKYVVQVNASNFAAGGPLFGYERTSPATDAGTTTLSPNNLSDRSLDFGYCKKDEGRIGDRVWIDQRNVCNGVQDPASAGLDGERGVNGVAVSLFLDTGGVLSRVAPPAGATWANPQLTRDLSGAEAFQSPAGAFGTAGYYLFDKLPIAVAGATYVVQVDAGNFAAGGPLFGYGRTFPATNSGTTTLSPSNLSDRSLDFGYCKMDEGRIGDRVWVDQRNVCNGVQDPAGVGLDGERGVNGVAVSLFLDTGGVLSRVAPPAGATWVNPQLTRDLSGAEAFQSPAGAFGTAGYYLFDKLPIAVAGATYVVQVDAGNFAAGGPLFGYGRTFPATNSGTTTLSPSNLSDRSLDFGYCKMDEGRIGDRVWVDQRNVCNGVQDPAGVGLDGERGVNGVAVSLFLDTGGVLSRVAPPAGATWANPQLTRDLSGAEAFQSPAGAFGTAGYYLFDKLPIAVAGATYVVQVDAGNFAAGGPLFGYLRTFPATNSGTTTLSPSNLSDRSLDFGYCTRDEGRIGDRVWVDQRNVCDGVQDPAGGGVNGERGVNGVSVSLFLDIGGVLSRVAPPAGATWANPQLTRDLSGAEAFQSPAGAFGTAGYYLFDRLPIAVAGATYVVQIDAGNFAAGGPLFGYLRTFPATNSGTTTLSPSNLSDRSLDFGYCTKVGRLGDRVWLEKDCNGIQDTNSGEVGIPNVRINLWVVPAPGQRVAPPAPIPGFTLTDANGLYAFDELPDLNYEVEIDASTIPAGFTRTSPATNVWSKSLAPGEIDLTLDFGYCKKLGRLGDRVWQEKDCNGIQDTNSGESGIPNVRVNLWIIVAPGQRITPPAPLPAFTFTDANGLYAFDELPDLNYEVEIDESTIPAGLTRTSPATTVWSKSLAPGEIDLTLDFGYCDKKCECQSGKVHELCVEARVWLADPSPCELDVYVKLDRGCPTCPDMGDPTSPSTMADLLTFKMGGRFPGEQRGANGLITVKNVTIADGYAKVFVCLEAGCPYFPEGWFDGDIHLEVTVNGVGEAFCSPIDCRCLKPEGVLPCDWKPLWCDDIPAFFVASYVPWECVPHEPCRPTCPPPCKPPTCEVPPPCDKPTCEQPKGDYDKKKRRS